MPGAQPAGPTGGHCSSWAGSGLLPAGRTAPLPCHGPRAGPRDRPAAAVAAGRGHTRSYADMLAMAAETSAADMRSSVAAARGRPVQPRPGRAPGLLSQSADHAGDRRHFLRVTEHVGVTHEEHLQQTGCDDDHRCRVHGANQRACRREWASQASAVPIGLLSRSPQITLPGVMPGWCAERPGAATWLVPTLPSGSRLEGSV